jgi:hypothetical protein
MAYIPAKIAVLPCMEWPFAARYQMLPLSNADSSSVTKLCTEFNNFVLDGFKNQPYMKGFSPKLLKQLLEKNAQAKLLDSQTISSLWNHQKDDCDQCQTPVSFYKISIAHRAPWNNWLNDLSKHAKNADAVLLPLIMYYYNKLYDDRGMMVAKTSASLTLLLISTDDAELLWSGGRIADISNKSFEESGRKDESALTKIQDTQVLFERLFNNSLWKDFPGRQNL